MNKSFLNIKVDGQELAQIMEDLTKAQETIYECYNRLNELGVLEISTEKAASGN